MDIIIPEINEDERVVATTEQTGEKALENSLRPRTLSEYVGQNRIKENLRIFLEAAKKRGEPIEHVLLYGAPGLGKTTLAHVIANEVGSNIRVTSGPAIEKTGDLAAILTNMSEGDILFIDEIHRLNRGVEEILYPAMEDCALDIVIGKGPSARTLRIDLPKFTIIGATTKVSALTAPLRDRFGMTYHLNYYEHSDIEDIIKRSSRILNIGLEEEMAAAIAGRSRRTPRIANRLLKRVRDYCEVEGDGLITRDHCHNAFEMLEVDEHGLDAIDRKILEVIIDKFAGGPVGLSTIAAATGEDISTIEDVYEPYLIQLGFLDRTPRGRTATFRAYDHLGREKPGQSSLI
jgi:Holliday junction DNA helicase RuvB